MHPYAKYQWPTVGNGKTSSHPDKLVWEEQIEDKTICHSLVEVET
jgi:hypothetical protein